MLGLSIPEVAVRGAARVDPATAALAARMTTAPDAARLAAIDAAVRALKAAGVWTKLAGLYLLAARDAQAARLNWVQDAYNLSLVGAPAFTVDRGYAGDGTATYLDTGWAANLGAQDSLCFGIWDLTNAQGSAVAGLTTAGTLQIAPRTAANTLQAKVNGATALAGPATVTDGSGLSTANRSGPNDVQLYKNGVLAASSAANASGAPGTATLALGRANTSVYSNHQFAACVIAASLTATEQAALYAALAGYMAAVGAA